MKFRVCVFAVGITGSGKTYFLRSLVQRVPRLLVVDITGDYLELPGIVTHTNAGDAAAEFGAARGGPCRVRLEADLDRAAIRALLEEDAGAGQDHDAIAQLMVDACAIAFAAGDVVLLIDEIAICCSPSYTPKPLKLVMGMGRHRGVTVLSGTQRPAMVSRTLTAMNNYTAFFRLGEDADLDWAATKLGRARSLELQQLTVGQHVPAGDAQALTWLRNGCPPKRA